MKEFAYFPGCSLEKIASSYHKSTMATTKKLDVKLNELEDWNCCGATTYFHVDELLAYTLVARNLAMAEKQGLDVVAPCSACYKNMFFTREHLNDEPDLADHINFALEEDNLEFTGSSKVKHLLELFYQDIGAEEIRKRVTQPLEGLNIAAYYGCQILRPRKDHEEVENPQFFEEIMSATGATPVDFAMKMRCCGGSLMISSRIAALAMVRNLLQNAVDSKAMLIATACPLCQLNLEVYQQQCNQEFNTDYRIPILYFTQIIGLAFGIAPKHLGIGSELVSFNPVLSQLKTVQ